MWYFNKKNCVYFFLKFEVLCSIRNSLFKGHIQNLCEHSLEMRPARLSPFPPETWDTCYVLIFPDRVLNRLLHPFDHPSHPWTISHRRCNVWRLWPQLFQTSTADRKLPTTPLVLTVFVTVLGVFKGLL